MQRAFPVKKALTPKRSLEGDFQMNEYTIQRINQIRQAQSHKLKELDRRQQKREANGLYHPDSKEDVDYIMCPIAQVRFTKIRKPHIENTLGITQEEYYELCPEMKGKTAERLSQQISGGLKEMAYDDQGNPVLDENGKHMSKYDVSHKKKMETLNEVDPETGMRRYDMLGDKTRKTHLNNKDEYGRNGYQQIASESIIKGNQTKAEKYGHRTGYEVSEFDRYSNIIDYFTYKCDRFLYTNGEDIQTRKSGGENAKQVDHLFTVKDGFNNKISPICISMPQNTQIISAKANEDKNDASTITKEDLFHRTGYTQTQSDMEYDLFIEIIYDHMEKGYHNTASQIIVSVLEELRNRSNNHCGNSKDFIEYMIDKDNYREKYTT